MWLGIDLGTSAVKVVVVDASGAALGEREAALPLRHPQPGHAEADPGEWTAAVDRLTASLTEEYDVRAVGVTGQMHGTVLVDEDGAVLRPAVCWPDSRAGGQRTLWDALPAQSLAALGNPWSPGMTGPVLAWLAEHEAGVVDRAHRVLLPKDVVRDHLAGPSGVTDPSDASGTLLWDVGASAWSPQAARLVPDRLLPPVREPREVVGDWREADVVVGGGDTAASLWALEKALGGWQPEDLVVNLGTGAQVISSLCSPPARAGWPDRHTYRGVTGELYSMVAAQNAGLALSWARNRLGLDWDRFAALARGGPEGAEGVVFSPFVTTERGPLSPASPDPGWSDAAASVVVAARAAAEAQAFLVRRALEVLDAAVRRVVLVGGGARDPWVRQLVADVLGLAVHHLPLRSAAAAGAVLLAGGPGRRQGALGPATEPRDHPVLADAYRRWRASFYPDP